ncbi:MAG TPA: hypothetical protein VJ787_02130, partial [Thermoleophilia bacterium]|nr:hypothetical protein [Thermoleophilia bacterium]
MSARRGRRLCGAARVAQAVVCAALLVLTLAPLAACSGGSPGPTATPTGSTASSSPSSLEDAFRAAHPSGSLPPGLQKAGDASRA